RHGDALPVGRPVRGMEERRPLEPDFARRAEALLRADHQPILAARVREPGDLLSIGRPEGGALRGPGAAGEIARIALLGGHREYFAPGREECAFAARRVRRRLA